jgi:hypothetical protein
VEQCALSANLVNKRRYNEFLRGVDRGNARRRRRRGGGCCSCGNLLHYVGKFLGTIISSTTLIELVFNPMFNEPRNVT